MIEKLRKKFIFFTMLAVISVFAVIILGVNGLFFYRTVNELNSTTQMIVNSDGHLRKMKNDNEPKIDDNEKRIMKIHIIPTTERLKTKKCPMLQDTFLLKLTMN